MTSILIATILIYQFFITKKVKPISVLANLSPQSSNRNRIGFFCIILCLILSFKTKRKPIFNLFYFGMLYFLFYNISLHISTPSPNRDQDSHKIPIATSWIFLFYDMN